MQQILYMIRKEFLQIFRTREMLAIIFLVPLIQMAILGFAITNEVKHVSLLIADRDDSHISREIVRAFSHTDRFDVVGYETDLEQVGQMIQSWKARLAIVIPENFGRDFVRQQQPQIQILVDGIDGNTAGVGMAYAQGILRDLAEHYVRDPYFQPEEAIHIHVVQMQERMWYNLNLNNAQFMIPGIVAALLTIISMLLSSMSLVREKEIGTLEQLMVTPLRKFQLLVGKLIPFLILSFVELLIVMQVAQIIFNIEMHGSYLLLSGMAFLFFFTTLGLGIFISTLAGTQLQAMFFSWFFMLFMILMSGFFIPIENMPDLLQKATYLNPMRYFMSILRDIMAKGSSLRYLLKDAIPLTVFGLIILSVSVAKFRKRVS